MRENADAVFASRDCAPLVATLATRLYANRFRAGRKTLYTLYNATGHTFAGSALSLPLTDGDRIFDLLACREADYRVAGNRAEVRLYLPRDDVACLVQMRRRLTVRRIVDSLAATTQWQRPDPSVVGGPPLRLAVCARDGRRLLVVPAKARAAHTIDLSRLGADARAAACVKLLWGKELQDITTVPGG